MFDPWVGATYKLTQAKGNLFPSKILLVGESNYRPDPAKRPPPPEENGKYTLAGFTTHLINLNINRMWPHPFFTKTMRLVVNERYYGKNEEERRKFWDSVAFYEYVTVWMENCTARPTKSQLEQSLGAFFNVINQLAPSVIIFLGNHHGDFVEENPQFREKTVLSYTIKHPASVGWKYGDAMESLKCFYQSNKSACTHDSVNIRNNEHPAQVTVNQSTPHRVREAARKPYTQFFDFCDQTLLGHGQSPLRRYQRNGSDKYYADVLPVTLEEGRNRPRLVIDLNGRSRVSKKVRLSFQLYAQQEQMEPRNELWRDVQQLFSTVNGWRLTRGLKNQHLCLWEHIVCDAVAINDKQALKKAAQEAAKAISDVMVVLRRHERHALWGL